MKFAYADPPYPGQAKRLYGDHPDYAGEVDHTELIGRLCRDYPDGWALSTSSPALKDVLALCPPDVRVAVWHRPDNEPVGKRGRWQWMWEPVIVHRGRPEGPVVRDHLSLSRDRSASLVGQKPPAFSRWMFALLGAPEGDELDDLFPGSGAVRIAWDQYQRQPSLAGHQEPPSRRPRPSEIARKAGRLMDPLLLVPLSQRKDSP